MTPEEQALADRVTLERQTNNSFFTDRLKKGVLAYLATQGNRRGMAILALGLTEVKVQK